MPRPISRGKTPQFSFRLEPELREALEILAEHDDRQLGPYIERQLKKHAAANLERIQAIERGEYVETDDVIAPAPERPRQKKSLKAG